MAGVITDYYNCV